MEIVRINQLIIRVRNIFHTKSKSSYVVSDG